jgi:hypothetical protein
LPATCGLVSGAGGFCRLGSAYASAFLTTNLAFTDWPSVFPNTTYAVALIDRVVHHADVIAIEGDIYRKTPRPTSKPAANARHHEQPARRNLRESR